MIVFWVCGGLILWSWRETVNWTGILSLACWEGTPGLVADPSQGQKWILNLTRALLDRGIAEGFKVVWWYRSGASYDGAGLVVSALPRTADRRWEAAWVEVSWPPRQFDTM